MRIDIVTIFPEALRPYLATSILKRAQEKRRVRIAVHDLRDWAEGKHRKVDDAPYGGGPGMVMQVAPFYRCLRALRASGRRTRVLLTSAKGRMFTQRDAERCVKRYDRLVILAGHYEGVDERVAKHLADEEVSIGPYVLTGGELPALVITDAVVRLLPGVLGNVESPKDESYAWKSTVNSQQSTESDPNDCRLMTNDLEHPQYTRPADFVPRRGVHWRVPKVLLSGDHAKIAHWRARHRT